MKCPFKEGNIIVLINKNNFSKHLTLYKEYKVVNITSSLFGSIGIVDDNNIYIVPNWGNFILKNEYRKRKLHHLNE